MTPRISAFLCSLAFLGAMSIVRADTSDKSLQNVKGQVSYQHGSAQTPIAPNATMVLADRDYAITGDESRGALTLPDSSVVTVGSDTKVQLAFFNQATVTSAKFILYNGRTRFAVRHPKGGKANYIFSTPTADIAVRGTEGDIGLANDSLQVNVYEVCDPSQPVQVKAKGGQLFTVGAGQSFVGNIVNGILKGQVEQLTQQLEDQLAGDLGNIPTNMNAAIGMANDQVNGAISNATGGIAPSINVGGLFSHKPKATPSPEPNASTCS